MTVLLYQGGRSLVKTSGIGRALEHQEEALTRAGVSFTKNEKDPYDLVQINTILPDSFFFADRARRNGKKVVYYAHSTSEDFKDSFAGSNLLAGVFKKWLKRCYAKGDLILTPTPYSKKLIDEMGLSVPVIPVSNGIDLTFFDYNKADGIAFRKKMGLSENEKIILSTGHYIERKGITDFVELAKSLPEYTFIWLGYTNLAVVPKKVRQAVRTKLPNLYFPGFVSKETLRDALDAAHLFLFLTHEETEGIALLEGFAMKVPVLIRDIPIYEELKDGETIYKAKEIKGFQSRIRGILENKLSDVTQKAYQNVQKKDLSLIGRQLADLYIELKENTRIN